MDALCLQCYTTAFRLKSNTANVYCTISRQQIQTAIWQCYYRAVKFTCQCIKEFKKINVIKKL